MKRNGGRRRSRARSRHDASVARYQFVQFAVCPESRKTKMLPAPYNRAMAGSRKQLLGSRMKVLVDCYSRMSQGAARLRGGTPCASCAWEDWHALRDEAK